MKPEQRYARRFVASMVAYIVLLIVSVVLLDRVGETLWRVPVALLPVLPVITGIFAFIALLRQIDELQQRIHLEAFAFSLGLTGVITFTAGLMESAGVLPSIGLIWVFPMMIAFWGIGNVIASRRYG